MKLPRIMLSAPKSGSGKTLITCGLLQVLQNRSIKACAFKCGPDYIDPLFHTTVLGTPCRNLDTFFTDEETTRALFAKQAKKAEISVLEGVMGFYDGVAGVTTKASSWELARVTDTPVIFVVNARGMGLSVVSLLRGFLTVPGCEAGADSHIRGVILNEISAGMYPLLKKEIETALPVKVVGYVPRVEDCRLESRHLGLVLPGEIADLKEKLQRLATILEETLDVDGILDLANHSLPCEDCSTELANKVLPRGDRAEAIIIKVAPCHEGTRGVGDRPPGGGGVSPLIAVAKDEAFCFYYEDNLDLLRSLGARLTFFSPLHDTALPKNIQGLLLGGGYPELYAKALSENTAMRTAIREAFASHLPTLAECGGFLYLQETLEGQNGEVYPMVGALSGAGFKTERLGRFGYITLTSNGATPFGVDFGPLRGHEFHYFDSTENGSDFHAQKPNSNRGWDCIQAGPHFLAGFPHLYYHSNPAFAAAFVDACKKIK